MLFKTDFLGTKCMYSFLSSGIDRQVSKSTSRVALRPNINLNSVNFVDIIMMRGVIIIKQTRMW